MYHNWISGSVWSGWNTLNSGTIFDSDPLVYNAQDGQQSVFDVDNTKVMDEDLQGSISWSGWTGLGGTWQ